MKRNYYTKCVLSSFLLLSTFTLSASQEVQSQILEEELQLIIPHDKEDRICNNFKWGLCQLGLG